VHTEDSHGGQTSRSHMRVLVTGGAGFIGSHLVDAFLAQCHDVLVIDNLSTGLREYVPDPAKLVVADIQSTEAATVIREFAPEVLCHHAAQMNVRTSVADPVRDAHVNIVGLVNVLEAARTAGSLRYVLFASSGGAVYGDQSLIPTPENSILEPASPYGLAKVVGEQYLALFRRLHSIPYVALRYSNVYGPRQTARGEAGVVSIFTTRLLAGEALRINGDGTQTRDFIYIDDVVRANLSALGNGIEGVFNVGTGRETTINQLADMLCEVAQFSAPRIYFPFRKGEQHRSALDSAKLAKVTGFRPQTSLRDGLEITFSYIRRSLSSPGRKTEATPGTKTQRGTQQPTAR